MAKYKVQVVNDEILKKLALKNRYNFLNTNLQQILSDDEFAFLKDVQKFCMKFEKEGNVTHGMDEDVYKWIPKFGEQGLVTRGHKFDMIGMNYGNNYGLTKEMMRSLAVDMFDPQFNMAMGASTLAINPIEAHHENLDVRLGALKDMVTGKAPGCILITEPERGSDATHMMTHCAENGDGSFTLNGTKIFNTTAPKSK